MTGCASSPPQRHVEASPPVRVVTLKIPASLLRCDSRASVPLPAPDAEGKYRMSDVDKLVLDLTAAGDSCAANVDAIRAIVEQADVS